MWQKSSILVQTLFDKIGKFAINKLNSYYKKGLTTTEQIGPKYASDPKWSVRVNRYINKLKK